MSLRKYDGDYTEPVLPAKIVAHQNGVIIQHYYRSGDHGPPHLHVTDGGDEQRNETRIGQNGRPLRNNPALTAVEQIVVQAHLPKIRSAVRKIGRWHWFQRL